MKLAAIVSALITAMLPGIGAAAEVDSTKRIDKRQENQENRIEQGRKSGDLSKKEAKRLEKGQRRVDRAEARMADDGKVTKGERKRLETIQDKQSKRIRNQQQDENKK